MAGPRCGCVWAEFIQHDATAATTDCYISTEGHHHVSTYHRQIGIVRNVLGADALSVPLFASFLIFSLFFLFSSSPIPLSHFYFFWPKSSERVWGSARPAWSPFLVYSELAERICCVAGCYFCDNVRCKMHSIGYRHYNNKNCRHGVPPLTPVPVRPAGQHKSSRPTRFITCLECTAQV